MDVVENSLTKSLRLGAELLGLRRYGRFRRKRIAAISRRRCHFNETSWTYRKASVMA